MKSVKNLVLSALILMTAGSVMAETAATEGAKLGEWTQDFDAAVKLARKKEVPILLNFSGSDWCGWCKLMTKNVFSKKEWKEYASEDIATVLIDFPKDKSLVPEKYVERNEQLREKFGVRGFPTYIVLDSDGETQLAQLGASRETTPESFIADLSRNLTYCKGEVEKYADSLKPADKKAYMAIVKKLSDNSRGIAEATKAIEEAEAQIEKLEKEAQAIKDEAAEFRARQKGPEALKAFKEIKAKYDKAVKELQDWLDSDPEKSRESMEMLREMKGKIDALAAELSAY